MKRDLRDHCCKGSTANHTPPLAIVGAACRLPGAEDLAAFATMLLAGRSPIREIDQGRWTSSRYFHPIPGQPGKTYSFSAGTLRDIFAFDAAFFGISPREAPSIDPQQRLILEVAYEASRMPAFRRRSSPGPTPVYTSVPRRGTLRPYRSPTSLPWTPIACRGRRCPRSPTAFSYIFDLHGPSLTIDTACSSS